MTKKVKPTNKNTKSTSGKSPKVRAKEFCSKLFTKAKQNKKISIPVAVAIIIAIIIPSVLLTSSNSTGNICQKAIDDLDYRTFYNKACAANNGFTKDDFIHACENSGKKFYDKSSQDGCISEEEYNNKVAADKAAEEEKARKKTECEAAEGKWNGYSCKSKEELEAEAKAKAEKEAEEMKKKEEAAKAAEEKKKQEEAARAAEEKKKQEEARKAEEANKTTIIAGQDHDANDNARKFDTLMNVCLDQVDSWYPGAYPLDSDDGYPIYYSVTVKADGTLVEGSMKGKIKTKYGNKILDYTCNYKDGVAKIRGLDD